MIIKYRIYYPGEPETRLSPSADMVTITVKSGGAGGDAGQFEEAMKQALKDWCSNCSVTCVEMVLSP